MTLRRRVGPDRGMVTAETAVVLPFLAALTFLFLWMVSLGITQVKLVDTAREAARMTARGDQAEVVRDAAERMAPEGAQVEIDDDGGATTVVVEVDARPAVPILGHLPSIGLRAKSVTATEPTENTAP